MMLMACASMNLGHLPKCKQLVDALRDMIESSNASVLVTNQSLVNVAWSLACLDCLQPDLLNLVISSFSLCCKIPTLRTDLPSALQSGRKG